MSIELGKYAFTVLAAWAATLVLLALIVAQTLLASARARRALDREENLRARREGGDGRNQRRAAVQGAASGAGDGAATGGAADRPAAPHPSHGG